MIHKLSTVKNLSLSSQCALWLSLLFIIFLSSCWYAEEPSQIIYPPDSIGPMKLKESKTGSEALKELFRLHGKRMGLANGYVGEYRGENGNATVYYSVAKNEDISVRLLEFMVKRIGEGNKYFQGLKEERRGSFIFYSVTGMGQNHFFFRIADKVIWIAADAPVAEMFLDESLKIYLPQSSQIK